MAVVGPGLSEQMLESAALLANLWNGIELDVRAKNAARVNKTLIETFYREISLPTDFGFIESEARGVGFSVAESFDRSAYIFRRQFPQYEGVTKDDLKRQFDAHGAGAVRPGDMLCPLCHYRFDEHPSLGTVENRAGSRYLRLIARATCYPNVMFEKALEI